MNKRTGKKSQQKISFPKKTVAIYSQVLFLLLKQLYYLLYFIKSLFNLKFLLLNLKKIVSKFVSLINTKLHNLVQNFKIKIHRQLFNFLKDFYLFFYPLKQFSKLKISFKFRSKISRRKLALNNFVIFSSIILLIFSGIFYYFILKDLPNPNELITRDQAISTHIYARDGSLLYKIFRNKNRTLVKLEDLPEDLINATIAIEDKNFYKHPGFSILGIIRALKTNLENENAYVQGGSTITQQLVKSALLSSEKTFSRKLKEVILAIEVELIFDKKEILQMYFNEIPYGGVSYGIEEAAQTYFGISAKDLNLAQSALLAGLPQAPTKYSPFGAQPQYAIYRQRQVLQRMLEDKYITQGEYKKAMATKINLNNPDDEIKAPHFVMYVKDLLVEKYGTRKVEEGGLQVLTTLDPIIQETAQNAVIEELDKLKYMNVTNAAVLVSNPSTGEILAMVGSRDYFDTDNDGNVNVTTQLRQPGSSIKPLTYALALQNGLTPNSTIVDEPVSYPDGVRPYQPVNYDGKFHGIVTLKTALASSFNIPAVKLLNKLGVVNLINFAQKMGISTWNDPSRFGLSLTLGGGEVKMTDMAVAYGVFANQGMKVNLNPILEIKDSNGKILQEFACDSKSLLPEALAKQNSNCSSEKVLNSSIAYQISDMLSDNFARSPAFGLFSLLNIPNHQVAVKTGTTNEKRDNWTIGYTKNFVVTVWVGNNNNTPMSAVASGITGATPIWRKVTDKLLEKNQGKETFIKPSELIPVQICADNGLLPCLSCRNVKTEYFIPGTEPKYHCLDATPTPKPQ